MLTKLRFGGFKCPLRLQTGGMPSAEIGQWSSHDSNRYMPHTSTEKDVFLVNGLPPFQLQKYFSICKRVKKRLKLTVLTAAL
jgi:hypothetical protein